MAAACSWHVDSLFRSTSMKLLLDSGIGLTPDLQLGTRHSRAVAAHAVETAVSAMREREVFLGFASSPTAPPPVGRPKAQYPLGCRTSVSR